MFESFEIKSYPRLNFALGAVNAVLLFACLAATYFLVLIPKHVEIADKFLSFAAQRKALDLVPIAGISCFWGWIATHFLRLHDRVHEPHVRKWRALYDADFILRSLLSDFAGSISQEIFIRAYHDKRVCKTLMQRLFYNFVGDEAETVPGRRMFFYTVMWRYWSLALLDLYACVFLILAGFYHLVTSSPPSPGLLLIIVAGMLVARIMSNGALDEAHEITEEQIAAIKSSQGPTLRRQVMDIATELGV